MGTVVALARVNLDPVTGRMEDFVGRDDNLSLSAIQVLVPVDPLQPEVSRAPDAEHWILRRLYLEVAAVIDVQRDRIVPEVRRDQVIPPVKVEIADGQAHGARRGGVSLLGRIRQQLRGVTGAIEDVNQAGGMVGRCDVEQVVFIQVADFDIHHAGAGGEGRCLGGELEFTVRNL